MVVKCLPHIPGVAGLNLRAKSIKFCLEIALDSVTFGHWDFD